MFSTVAAVVCIAFIAQQITTTSAANCPTGWVEGAVGAAMAPCYLAVPGTTTLGQARLFCASLAMNNDRAKIGYPNSMQDATSVHTQANGYGIRTYWVGIERSAGAWIVPGAAAPNFTNWRRGQPDGCCGRNVSCVIAGYLGIPGALWDDTGCDRPPRGLDGYLCRIR